MNIKRILLEIDPWNIVFGKLQKVYRLECILTEILETLELQAPKNFFGMIDYHKLQDMLDAEEEKILPYDKTTTLNHQQQIKIHNLRICFQISNLICAHVNYQNILSQRRNSLFFVLVLSVIQPFLAALLLVEIPVLLLAPLVVVYFKNIIAKHKDNITFHGFSLKNSLEYAKKLQNEPLNYADYKIEWTKMAQCKFNCYELHAYSQTLKYPEGGLPDENQHLGQNSSQNRIFP